MNRNISDLMDHIRDADVELETNTPLSASGIKELTMRKIEQKKKPKRIAFRVLMAAAIIVTLAVSVFAAEKIFGAGDWFRDILNAQLTQDAQRAEENGVRIRESIGEDQLDLVSELGKVFEEQSQTSQGTTVTLKAAYGDAYMLHLYLSVEAPEGIVLPDGILYEFCDRNAIDYSDPNHYKTVKPGEDAPYDTIFGQMEIHPVADVDPTDNKKDFYVVLAGQAGTEAKYNDGYSKYFCMTGIYEQVPNVDADEDGYVQLTPGDFCFDISLGNEVQIIELDVSGYTYGGEKTRSWTHDSECQSFCNEELTGETDPKTGLPIHSETYNYQVTVESMSISPLSAEWEVSYTSDDRNRSFGLDFRVVMKDGTSAMNDNSIGGEDSGTGSRGITYFTTPINLDEVDYILIGDEELGETYKIYLPETSE